MATVNLTDEERIVAVAAKLTGVGEELAEAVRQLAALAEEEQA